MAWSREGTSEELSKYQEFQMRQNDGHHHRSQAQPHSSHPGAGVTFPTPQTATNNPTTITAQDQDRRSHLVTNSQPTGPGSFSEAVRGSQADQTQKNTAGGRLRTEQSRRSDRLEPASEPSSTKTSQRDGSLERTLDSPHSTRQRPSPSSSPSSRHSKSSRSKTKSKGHDDGSQHGLDLSTSPAAVTRSERAGTMPGSPHCQRYRHSGSSTKKGCCACSSCQQEGSILTPSQRSYRYAQYLGSDPIPIYAGPLGLGDDIPSPTPSPPAGRMSIHMAMSGHSPIGSPVHSPALSISHSPMGKSSPSFLRSPGSSKSKSSRHQVTEGFSGSGEFGLHDEQHRINSDATSNTPTSHHPVVTGFQTCDLKVKNSKKKFEAWSLSEQIQDRIVRAAPYKSAVLSPNTIHARKLSTTLQQLSHSHPHPQPQQQTQPSQSQPHHQPEDQPQPQPQPQLQPQLQQNYSPQPDSDRKPTLIPVESSPTKRQWQWQWRGQSASKDVSGDRTPRKTAANTITNRKVVGGLGLGSPVVGNSNSANSASSSGNQVAAKTGNEGGSSLHVLRRTRSAPILASGQLSYADILKASIKATSDSSLSSSSSSGYVSLLSTDSNTSHLHLTGSSSPLVTTNTTSVSGTISSFNNSPDASSYRSRLIAPLTPTRTMKPLRRRSLSNIKGEMSASTASLKSFMTPLRAAAEIQSLDMDASAMDVDETLPNQNGGSNAGDDRKEMEMADTASPSGSEDVEMSIAEETVEEVASRGMIVTTSGARVALIKSEEEDEPARNLVKSESATGLSFFTPPEELDAAESSPDTICLEQSIVAGSMMEFEPTVDTSTETLPESDATSTLVRAVSAPVMVSPISPSLASNVSLAANNGADVENDSYESITLESPDIAGLGPVSSLQEKKLKVEEESIVVAQASEVPVAENEVAIETKVTSVAAEASVVAEEPECPFQKQLALQEQEETETQQSKIAAGFKARRKRNDSSGGKKLLLKKMTSLPNLRNSFQQQQPLQQAVTSHSESDGSKLDSSTSTSGKVASSDYVIPPFYFPKGKPVAASKRRHRVHSAVTKAKEIFVVAESGVLSEAGFVTITVHCCELPRYMNRALFRKVDLAGSGEVRLQEFERVWESLVETCPDEISMIFAILKQPNANVLTPTDFEAVLQDLVLFHPGLEFLSGNAVFQERYLETVITRIFYEANRRHGKMKLSDLRRSNFDKTLRKLENSDLNQTEDCFSYKHFYVIYCKFWELDQDHDLILDEQDLAGYSGGAISTRIIRRVMQGYGNETGMFMVPDQELLLQQQQQQQLLLIQQQQQQQQLLQQQQHLLLIQRQQQQQTAHLQTESSAMDLDTTILANPSEDNGDDGEEANKVMAEMTTPPGEGSPAPETKTLRRSKTMTLSGVNISSEFITDGMTSPVPEEPLASPSIASTPTSPSPVTMNSPSPTAPIAGATIQRTIPPGPGTQCRPQNYRMTYKGFIWFLLAETDKQTVTSIEYWFRCMDLDGDGLLTVFELEQLFQEQAARMALLGMESFGFRDAICQMQDLIGPKETGLVRLSDLKQCGQAGPFIDLFCNVVRWRNFEANQHQIRMRQQQIAMQRATEAAWEEVAAGEDLFDDDDEDGDDEGEEDEDDCEEDDEEEEDEDVSDDYADGGSESPTSTLSDTTELSFKSNAAHTVSFSTDIEMGEGKDLLSASELLCVGLGLAVEPSAQLDADAKGLSSTQLYQNLGLRRGGSNGTDHVKAAAQERGPGEVLEDDHQGRGGPGGIMDGTVELNPEVTKALNRRNKEKRRKRRQSMVRLALLGEQRKEKALLATIRESPWIVYVESEYEKLVTIERPQSRTGWEQEDEEEEEDEEDEDEDDLDDPEDGPGGGLGTFGGGLIGEGDDDDEEEVMNEDHLHHLQHQQQQHLQHLQHHLHLNVVEGVDHIQLQLQQQQQQQQQYQQYQLLLQQQQQQQQRQQGIRTTARLLEFEQISIDP
ncbi:Serine/threonine-protein phosphatase 2A regulatory subunit B'' subunit alpha [Linnemannia hyalina]|uniref:Serine/threonine-protein phosphatase 2A regulatory subunit B'' subunit alpha n=1 Tax=Linnemannia hyalina TaxID=64524 RepID=A0A9P7XV40_9FUNG|nr:Serine/threonine-protein phosphatase 2A regulatory subunit B'' subunit alpha [Linnemannia hyalina]